MIPTPRLLLLLPLLLLLVEPSLANKFETIGEGLAGSPIAKAKFLRAVLLTGGTLFMLGALLAVVFPRSHAAFLNFANWKISAAVMATFGTLLLIGFFLV